MSSNKRILVIEDSPDVAEMLRMYFSSQQYEVYHAETGPEGVEMARTKFPNLILLDVMLPELDGYDVCKTLRQKALTRFIPIIFLTQRDERASKVKGLELGADDYITKPFDIEELRLRVRNSIDAATRDHLHEVRTGLPTGPLVEEELNRRRKAGEACNVVRFSVDNYRAYGDVYGFMAANEVMSFAARVLRETVLELGTPHDFVGIQQDELVLLTHRDDTSALQAAVQEAFKMGIRAYYSFEDVERGGLVVDGGDEGEQVVPLMSLAAQTKLVS